MHYGSYNGLHNHIIDHCDIIDHCENKPVGEH